MPRKKITARTKEKINKPSRASKKKVSVRGKKTDGRGRKIAARRGRKATAISKRRRLKPFRDIQLEKFVGNPIIEPDDSHEWESQYAFNPAAVYKGGRAHLVYRAIGASGISILGYASAKDCVRVDERLREPIYVPREPFEFNGKIFPDSKYAGSGGGFGGCEDPRITELGDRLYMTYTAFNGYPRVALASIATDDFLRKNWRWKPAVLISAPGEVHKNWVIFPEKIRGKYAILHSISPKILVDYFDNLDFDGTTFISSYHSSDSIGNDKRCWDCRVRGVGPPPIKTKDGWLVIYHAIDDRDPGKYKIGAMILDYQNPERVLYRSSDPILEPDERYENEGFKSGVVYSCGAVVAEGTLFVYYGGADTVTCVASADLNKFLRGLKVSGSVRIKKMGRLKQKRYVRH
ncbi:MAG: hypothetical protein AAB602_01705 [Patescibacteria group bacterium]